MSALGAGEEPTLYVVRLNLRSRQPGRKFSLPMGLDEARSLAIRWAADGGSPVAIFKLVQTHHIKPPIVVPDVGGPAADAGGPAAGAPGGSRGEEVL